MSRPVVLAAALLLVAAAGCGGGGSPTSGGGGGGGGGGTPPAGVIFTPGGTAGGNAILLTRGTGPDARTLVLEVEAREVSDLYGAYFDLAFPSGVLTYESATEGTLLASGGLPTTFQVSAQDGNLVIGITRLGDVSGADGSGVLLTLRFRGNGAGTGDLTFSRNRAVDPEGATVDGLVWVAGRVENRL